MYFLNDRLHLLFVIAIVNGQRYLGLNYINDELGRRIEIDLFATFYVVLEHVKDTDYYNELKLYCGN